MNRIKDIDDENKLLGRKTKRSKTEKIFRAN
jgi:hypothetical protein